MGKFIDLTGMQINDWHVDKYLGKSRWLCTCKCGNVREVSSSSLTSGESKRCRDCANAARRENLDGQQFGEWTVIETRPNGRCLCKCSCGKVKEVDTNRLKNGTSRSCGKHANIQKALDLIGQRFGRLVVKEYMGNSYLKCECDCGNETVVYSGNLRNGGTLSCGCLKHSGDSNRIYTREQYLETIEQLTLELGDKPFIEDVAEKLGVHEETVRRNFKKLDISMDNAQHKYKSKVERELHHLFPSGEIHNRMVLGNKELDLYFPEKKVALEYNGSYWHSEIYRDKYYHQNKAILCGKAGVQLIQIFENEWSNIDCRNKLIKYIRGLLDLDKPTILYARQLEIKEIDGNEADDFCNKHHLQNSSLSSIRIGAYYDNRLVSLMTFGKPRFNDDYEYELIRYCNDLDYRIVGGAERIFNYFIKNYNPLSVITYSDMSKFTGMVYLKLGFTLDSDRFTEPGYMWYNKDTKEHINRYSTQKNKLVKIGLGESNQTEEEIMHNLGYIKVYTCGNIKFIYKTNEI